jgi:glycosyltransferase involved in cell wall biosynthesis
MTNLRDVIESGARIDIVTRLDPDSPSLKNISQGLEPIKKIQEINIHQLQPPDLPGEGIPTKVLGLAALDFKYLKNIISLRLGDKSDIVIVHKSLQKGLISRLLMDTIAEIGFVSYDPDYKTVYSTYDADYISKSQPEYLFKTVDRIFATSKAIEREAKKATESNKICYIPPSVDISFFTPDASPPDRFDTDSLVLGWVGNSDVHGDDLRMIGDIIDRIPAASNQSEQLSTEGLTLRFLLGGGSLPSELEKSLEKTQISVDIIEYVPWEDVPKTINSFDIGLAPLQDTEFNRARSSEKVREYMACGIPVIASDVGENPHLVGEDAGVLTSTEDDWVAAIDMLSDEKTRAEMGEKARNRACNMYSTTMIAEQIKSCLFDRVNQE